ncbi:MAG: hypothetical protein ACTSX0_02675 [Promethearchaeota archaeon]
MELSLDISDLIYNLEHQTPEQIKEKIRKGMESLAIEWEGKAKEIISDTSVDTGEYLNSVHYEMFEDGDEIGFIGEDAVKYGIYIEKGTVQHFVPFYKWTGDGYDVSQPILADWGKRVLGMTEEEMLAKGGIKVKQTGNDAFMKGLLYIEGEAKNIFNEVFKE